MNEKKKLKLETYKLCLKNCYSIMSTVSQNKYNIDEKLKLLDQNDTNYSNEIMRLKDLSQDKSKDIASWQVLIKHCQKKISKLKISVLDY